PTLIASFWGMNVNVPFEEHVGLFGFSVILGVTLVVCVLSIILLRKKDMF
ncbi:MAG: magnesium transporter CorA family protein, partial [Clostridia bacterium]|nr:magnesium transporter CorA family protein [Clostridia bacterium]